MKKLILILLLLPSFACADGFSLRWNATFAPVNHEPVVGNLVARYRLQATPQIDYKRLHYAAELTLWGAQKWRPRHMLGSGFVEKYENSDWNVQEWRTSIKHRLTIDLYRDRFGIFAEYYIPINRHTDWGPGNDSLKNYYLLTGFGGKLW